MLDESLIPYRYSWPHDAVANTAAWHETLAGDAWERGMPESREELSQDSRWPAFFPSPMCLVTAIADGETALEKVVGPSIVNRFPYIMAISFCRESLSDRHHPRDHFTRILEKGEVASVQFLAPGSALDAAMKTILTTTEADSHLRIKHSGLSTRPSVCHDAPVFSDAYLVYECRLVRPGKDFDGEAIYEQSWKDVGSHRVYFLEVIAIQLRQDIAEGRSQIRWQSLPDWQARLDLPHSRKFSPPQFLQGKYKKSYTPRYSFPALGTRSFNSDEQSHGMNIQRLPPLPIDQVEVDNDRARWPCFFPSSLALITSWADGNIPNLMPCGSTTILSRHPLVIAPCISYARINQRYAPRASLDIIRGNGRFGCSVPFVDDTLIEAVNYSGNISLANDPKKVMHSGLSMDADSWAPVIRNSPVHFDCEVTGEVRLGTHIMFLGEVRRIRVRQDVTKTNPLHWCPWATVSENQP